MTNEITKGEKSDLVGMDVTLNGIRARITGRFARFPHVSQLAFPFQSVEYSWWAIANVIAKGGKFSTA